MLIYQGITVRVGVNNRWHRDAVIFTVYSHHTSLDLRLHFYIHTKNNILHSNSTHFWHRIFITDSRTEAKIENRIWFCSLIFETYFWHCTLWITIFLTQEKRRRRKREKMENILGERNPPLWCFSTNLIKTQAMIWYLKRFNPFLRCFREEFPLFSPSNLCEPWH